MLNRQGFFGCLNFVFLHQVSNDLEGLSILGVAAVVSYIASSAIQDADKWGKTVGLRPGKSAPFRDPGLSRPRFGTLRSR